MLLVNSTTLRYLKLKYYAPKCNPKNLRILCKNAGKFKWTLCKSYENYSDLTEIFFFFFKTGNWFILEYIVVNIKPNYFTTLINCLFDEFYDKRGKPLINQTVMDKYKRMNNENFPSTSYSDNNNYFDLPTTNYNNFNNQFANTNTFNQPRNAFLAPSSPTNDLVIPSIISSSKIGSTTARRPKKKQLRTSLSTSLAAKTSDSFGRPEWDNQSNHETAPFLNELTELDLEGPAFPSNTLTDRKSKLREFRKYALTRKDKSSSFGTTANDTSLTNENVFESFPMNPSDEEWK